jgi:hypothetical protein
MFWRILGHSRLYMIVCRTKKCTYMYVLNIKIYIFNNIAYEGGSKRFWPDQLFKVTEIKQLCYFSI